MKTAGIALDNYKVQKFEQLLKEKGYNFTTGPGLTKDTQLIKVMYEDFQFSELKAIVETAEMITTGANKNKN